MTYATADARKQLFDDLAAATDELSVALAALGEAYEALDEHSAEQLERDLFAPVQGAYGRAQRTCLDFASRHGLPSRAFSPATPGPPSSGAKGFLEQALRAVAKADSRLAALQDSMLPVEVGDAPLRSGLQQVRASLADVGPRARELMRTLGR